MKWRINDAVKFAGNVSLMVYPSSFGNIACEPVFVLCLIISFLAEIEVSLIIKIIMRSMKDEMIRTLRQSA